MITSKYTLMPLYSAIVVLCVSGVIQDSQKAAAVARSFSLSWRNHGEQGGPGVQEPMRIRSATTSGAPGVENARNNVRQKASGKCLCSHCVLQIHQGRQKQKKQRGGFYITLKLHSLSYIRCRFNLLALCGPTTRY